MACGLGTIYDEVTMKSLQQALVESAWWSS